MSAPSEPVSEEEKLWGFIAWLLSIVGAVLALVLKPGYRYARYWAYLSAAYFIVIVAAWVVSAILGFIPIVGWVLGVLISLAVFIVWIVGILKSLSKEYWRPPLVYDIAKMLGIEKV